MQIGIKTAEKIKKKRWKNKIEKRESFAKTT